MRNLKVGRRPLIAPAAILAGLLCVCGEATGEPKRWFGVELGAAGYLKPAKRMGPWLAFSAALSSDDSDESAAMFATRGSVGGFYAGADSWVALPTLTGDAGLKLGPVELLFSAGVELFGVAKREQWLVFSTIGFLGGARLSVDIGPRWRAGCRGQMIWLPHFSTAKLEGPEDNSGKPLFLLVNAALFAEYLGNFDE